MLRFPCTFITWELRCCGGYPTLFWRMAGNRHVSHSVALFGNAALKVRILVGLMMTRYVRRTLKRQKYGCMADIKQDMVVVTIARTIGFFFSRQLCTRTYRTVLAPCRGSVQLPANTPVQQQSNAPVHCHT